MSDGGPKTEVTTAPVARRSHRRAGRPRTHGYRVPAPHSPVAHEKANRRQKHIAVAVRSFKAHVSADLGGNLSRAQEVILESAAQKLGAGSVNSDVCRDYALAAYTTWGGAPAAALT